MSVLIPTCPTDCLAQVPNVSFSLCAPTTNSAQIYNIYVGNVGSGFTNLSTDTWSNAGAWASKLGSGTIKRFHVIGDKPAPEGQEKTISHGRVVIGKKKHTINIVIDETNATNHNMLRTLECGGQFAIWYESSGGLLWGGNDGIVASVKLDEIIPVSEEDLITFGGTIKWISKFTPERITSPIA